MMMMMMMRMGSGDSLKILKRDLSKPRIPLILECMGLNDGTCCGQSISTFDIEPD